MAPALLAAFNCNNQVHLIIGSNSIAGARCAHSLEVGAKVILLAPANVPLHYGLSRRIEENEIVWLKRDFHDADLTSLGRDEVDNVVDVVFVTLGPKNSTSIDISNLCHRLRIPVNVTDAPKLSSFTLPSIHRDGPLQIGITTSGKGCKLASRIRREIASLLPSGLGAAVDRLGSMRRSILEEDYATELSMNGDAITEEDDSDQMANFNRLVSCEDAETLKSRRTRWLAQICEYWPLQKLVSITEADINLILRSFLSAEQLSLDLPSIDEKSKHGRITLAGAGPGNPDLLTIAAHKAIQSADLVLADKLVPAPIMDLVPRRAEVHIARKFPGNADKAQEELLDLGIKGLKSGKSVVRIKQGDPYIYGRGAEEYDFFHSHGFIPIVIPGITSALSAPLFACIPPTHRSLADQVLICTGTGRKGALPDPPVYVETQTVVLLMALHRLPVIVETLTSTTKQWPKDTPCAVIERASCHDQRIIRTTLEWVCAAVDEEGSRPPGLLVLGKSCELLRKTQQRWAVEEGFSALESLRLATIGEGSV